jgi:hypothetical protein
MEVRMPICTKHLILLSTLLIAVGTTSCGETTSPDDPASGILDEQAVESHVAANEIKGPDEAANEAANETPPPPETPPAPTVPLALADSMPVSLGSTTYSTEAGFILGVTEQARSLLYNAAKPNWLVSADVISLEGVFNSKTVTLDVRSLTNSSDQKTIRQGTGNARQWLIEDPTLDPTTQWTLDMTVKVPLLNQSKIEEYCAVLKSQKIISPKQDVMIPIRDFTFSVTSGSCSSVPGETITQLSAKTKIAPGDSKQTVAVVMGTSGLQVISPQLWCWVGSKVSSGCGYRSFYYFYESSTNPKCDCEVRFNSSGTVSGQKGLSGTVLDVTRW